MSALPTSSSSPASESVVGEALHRLELALNERFPPLIQLARVAWRRDLPVLLKLHPGEWVAYHGEKQVGIGRNKTELYQHCLCAGLQRGDFLVLRIEPEPEHQVSVPVDV